MRPHQMLFNSLVFLPFFLIVYGLYLLARRQHRLQNFLLFVASYCFYGYWDWRFLSLLAASTLVDFVVGRRLAHTETAGRRRALLLLSVATNLGILAFFKYFNFFAASLVTLFDGFGLHVDPVTLHVVLPVGISFYTFQTLSYTIDVYRGRLEPTRNLLDFALFVSFFPQLVAGPIERAASLLPQVARPRRISPDQVHAGLYLILWGYFQKVVVADNCGVIANRVFDHYWDYSGLDTVIGVVAFALQIYADFAGYSNIARGLAKLLGFDLMVNFRLPYLALNPSDFWSRWHVSLSTWLRDYLYIPLGGNRRGSFFTARNLMITMVLGGLWHGAAWNFVLWGFYHGALLGLYRRFDRAREHEDPWSGRYSRCRVFAKMGLMFVFTLIGWILFRSRSFEQIIVMLTNLGWSVGSQTLSMAYNMVFFAGPMIGLELFQYRRADLMAPAKLRLPLRILVYAFLMTWILVLGARDPLEFVYFQF